MPQVTADQARDVFRRHAAQLGRADAAAVRRLLAVYEAAARDILGRTVMAGSGITTFTAQHYSVVLGQLQAGIAELWQRLGGAMTESERAAVELAQKHIAESVATLSGHFEGTVRPFSVRPIFEILQEPELFITRDAAARGITGRLLERARTELAVSMATREPFFGGQTSTVSRIQHALGVGRYEAERAARTEHARAYNAAHHGELVEANAQGGDYRKTIVAVHDSRTDEDTVGLERWLADRGGSIRLDELFRDGDGRQYLHPPGRPNDRCVEVPWRADWGGMDDVNAITGGPRGLLSA